MKEALTYDDVSIIPKFSNIKHRADINLTSELADLISFKTPIISSPMDTVTGLEMLQAMQSLGGLGVLHRFMTIREQVTIMNRFNSLFKAAAIGVTNDFLDRASALFNAGVNIFVLDVAHGDHSLVENALEQLRNTFKHKVILITGNVATAKGAKRLIEAGTDGLRVGIGSGSLCSTRITTGVGVPMITCIQEIKEMIDMDYSNQIISIIADGGIKTPGDAAKALAAGADFVMLGSLLSGTKEAPGNIIKQGQFPNEVLFKGYRGSASLSSKVDRGESKHVEGYSTLVPYKGKTKRIIDAVVDGIKSSFSYVGANNIKEFHALAEFVKVTNAGMIEATPHLLNKGI